MPPPVMRPAARRQRPVSATLYGAASSKPSTVKFNHVKTSGSGAATFKAHHARLMSLSENIGAPPEHYDQDKQYRIRLKRVVVAAVSNHILRPSDDVVVSGDFATTIAEHISGAVEV